MHRPWTAIMSEQNYVTAVNVSAAYEKEAAKRELEERYPGKQVVALIPGEHATYTHTFGYTKRNAEPSSKNTSAYIDPFDTSHVGDPF